MTNDSALGRLLEEISWEGHARKYRFGGRGYENVLMAEVFQVLDLLPRDAFLGEMLRAAHGADAAREGSAAAVEEAIVDVLPGGPDLADGGPNIQPDAYLRMPGATVIVEAKRIRGGVFGREQLAREYLTLMRDHPTTPTRLLLLILPAPPPVIVQGAGRLEVADAIISQLPAVHAKASHPPPLDLLLRGVEESWAWITWAELAALVRRQSEGFTQIDATVSASIQRMAASITRTIDWHT